ncbi:MAG TPA: VCBS repeat-containing protein [Chitinophagaceae bacterium]|nr:VCBS repeat-containing protein [Chitinophagaceae bacterium]
MIKKNTYLLFMLLSVILFSCKNNNQVAGDFHFKLMDAGETGIDFNNKITESDSVNVYLNEYMYNGSGVGIGDFNNDGLPDIFFAGSMVSSRLYINKGNFKFEDITENSGLQTNRWCTGVSVVDINNDGFMDIYVCSSHSPDKEKRRNLLFINDGKLHFSEQAAAYGLADTGFSTQAVFFDYDKDGDLDMYLLNHRLYSQEANNLVQKDTSGNSPAEDRLYRNNGFVQGQSHPVFSDVSKNAGIREDGYGLGVVITDVNNDNWPDIYIANDYIGNDLLWLNNKNGSFSNIISTSLRHQSYNSMGVDAADINNDALADIAVLDMLPENNERKKMMFSNASQERYDMQLRMGYEPEFVRNMLQLNNGVRKVNGQDEPFYSEIGQLAGISETDWSWSVLIADFDNDGWKDIHVTNGIVKDVTNNDYVAFKNAKTQNNYVFGENSPRNSKNIEMIRSIRKNLDQYESVKTDNYFFHNNKKLGFDNYTKQAGLSVPSISNGAAYADLDNDGDLDMVTNNMNQPAFLWRNELRQPGKGEGNNFITTRLIGLPGNPAGFGSKVYLYNNGTLQFLEQSPVRGFCSSVDDRLHFGVGNATTIDSLQIVWPNDKMETIRNVKANQFLMLKNENAKEPAFKKNKISYTLFSDVTAQSKIDFTHKESPYFDFGFQRALPQKYSQLGPPLATADINGDGLQDFFIGGAAYQSGKIFIQQVNGAFIEKDLVEGMKNEEDLGAVFFDADGDKDPDLLVTGGSNEFGAHTGFNHPRLYNNDGKGDFLINTDALPAGINDMAAVVSVADIDGDGDMDIFIGGRMLPEKYPQSPRSYILQNDHGKFTDITKNCCLSLEFAGLVTGAVFTHLDNDKRPDLVLCGEWMPVRFFKNEKGKLTEFTGQTGLGKMNGQWRSLQAADIDNDGDIDFVAGNLGLNNKFHVSVEKPLQLYAGDFDGNRSAGLIPAYYIKDNASGYELFPALDRNQLADQLPSVKKKFLLHGDYAKATMKDLLNTISTKDMAVKTCETTASIWIENRGNGKFVSHVLPLQAQFAPVNSILIFDADGDNNMDLLLAGNEYQNELATGPYDASYGLLLKGNGKGDFTPIAPVQSGFILDGDIKCMKEIENKNKDRFILAAANNGRLKCLKIKGSTGN